MTLPAFRTVAQAIAEVGRYYPENDFVFQDLRGNERRYTFVELERETGRRAAALQERGMRKGDRIGIIVIEPEDFVLTFLAALRVGVIPVPLYPPMSFGSLDAYADRTRMVLDSAGARLLIASAKLQNVLWALVDKVPSLERLVPVEQLAQASADPVYPEILPEDMAFLQYTSGSTADPKGVMVTHGSLIANSRGIITEGLQLEPERDKGISWLPLYHDMGLIGFVIAPICHAISAVFIPTLRFVKKPSVWLDTIHRHRGTASFAPNFAYALACKKVKDEELDSWDLSCVRVLGCGAEPIHPDTMRRFTELFSQRSKLPTTAITPAYGMAEATLAISLKRTGEHFRTVVCDAERFQEEGQVTEPVEGKPFLEHVSCGQPFSGHEVRAVDADGNFLPEGHEGELVHKGPSVTPGYFNAPQATAAAFRDGWLHTGDLGFVRDGEVFITGRLKDLIIVNGRNIHPQAVEWLAQEVDGVRKGNVVAFSVPGDLGEELVIVFESRRDDKEALQKGVRDAVQRDLSLSVRDVVVLPPGTLPKTSSGKLQRRKTRQHYMDGRLGAEGPRTFGAQGSTLTVARHVARSVWTRARSSLF